MSAATAGALSADAPILEPDPRQSLADLAEWREKGGGVELLGRPLREWQSRTRGELGVPSDRPVVLAGHQAGIWHAGILAKWFAIDALAARLGGAAVQLTVDQDINDAADVPYPALSDGRLGTASLPHAQIAPTTAARGPTGLAAPVRFALPQVAPAPEIAAELARLRDALNANADSARTLAEQCRATNDSLLAPLMAPPVPIAASALLATEFGGAFVAALRDDAERAIAAYNAALARAPQVARPLRPGELPLWSLARGERAPVLLAHADASTRLAPRALAMTAFARLVLADLFVHGTGGARYERVTEAWVRGWLGVELAPMSVATATLRLPLARHLGDEPVVSHADLRRALFDPDSLDGPDSRGGPSAAKRRFLERIDAAPRRSLERRQRYRELLRASEEARATHADALDAIRARHDASRHRAVEVAVARNRLWPWPLHGRDRLLGLRDAIRAAV